MSNSGLLDKANFTFSLDSCCGRPFEFLSVVFVCEDPNEVLEGFAALLASEKFIRDFSSVLGLSPVAFGAFEAAHTL